MSHAYTYKAVIDSMLSFAKAVFVGYYVRSAYNSLNRFYDSFSKTLQDSTIIHNETSETVTFLVYNASDPCINAQWKVWHWSHLFNLCWSMSCLPHEWKIHKLPQSSNLEISLLSRIIDRYRYYAVYPRYSNN